MSRISVKKRRRNTIRQEGQVEIMKNEKNC